jgi:hypothetical protein
MVNVRRVRATTPLQRPRACPVRVAALTVSVPAVPVPQQAPAVPVRQPVPVVPVPLQAQAVPVRVLRAPALPVPVLPAPAAALAETVLLRA